MTHAAKAAAAPPPDPEGAMVQWRHGLSQFGGLKYPSGFKHFDYVNPGAAKGGRVRQGAFGTYDNFNMAVSGLKGVLAVGIELIYDNLMVPSLDEVSSNYGLIAEAACYPPDYSWAIYRLRSAARWHDGRPITPDDVIFSLDAFKQNNPEIAAYYRNVLRAERVGDGDVRFVFDMPGNRELPLIVGQLTVLPRHWWTGTDASGEKREVTKTTLEPPLGSGPYQIRSFEAGKSIVYERDTGYWARDLPVNVGTANFDELRFDYFRDTDVEFEAFKADDLDWRTENAAARWATGYDFPAVGERRVVREEFPIRNHGIMQAFVFNIRNPKFQDVRVRRAFNFAFDFERMNRELFYGEYTRISSYFSGTELASSGRPSAQELTFLLPLRSEIPSEVFTTPYWNPINKNTHVARLHLLYAERLLNEAGHKVRNLELIDPHTGVAMTVEFLIGDANLERVILFYKPSLERLGIAVSVRLVDDVQYVNRLRDRDFDIVVSGWPESLTPENELRDYFGSHAADMPGSGNLVGIRNPAVDTLIDRIVAARSRRELTAAVRALDRVLLWNHYVVPQWTLGKVRTARWDRFGRPARMPEYGLSAFPALWWWDAARAAKTNQA